MPTSDDTPSYRLAIRLGQLLRARSLRLVCAESCTGGWVAKAITDVAGASSWFEASLTVYSDAAKQRVLGVPPETIAQFGAVSGETAAAMVNGALAVTSADMALAVTGIAGPEGGNDRKPVGTVWLAWQQRQSAVLVAQYRFDGDRNAIRCQSVDAALRGVVHYLS